MKRAADPVLSAILRKVRMGICDEEVEQQLQSRLEPDDVSQLDLSKTVVICSTRAEIGEINNSCLERLPGQAVEYTVQ